MHALHHKENEPYVDPDSWTQNAAHTNGSWWLCLADWLTSHSGEKVAPPSMELRKAEIRRSKMRRAFLFTSPERK
jgi:poly(3-hydroxyalkanoate) synthetase